MLRDAALRPGSCIRMHGLASRPELNGRTATLIEWSNGRWNAVVGHNELNGDESEGVRLKLDNIKPIHAFEVVDVKHRGGVGCIATRDIERGERLLAESPITVEGPGFPDIEDSVAALSVEDRATFFALAQDAELFGVGTPKSIEGILATNGMPFYHGVHPFLELERSAGGYESYLCGGIFPLTARFNHACDANAACRWEPQLGRRTVHAVQSISAGDEITISYGFDSTFLPYADRQRRLLADFGFRCACTKCALPEAERKQSDERAAAIGTDTQLLRRLQAWSRRSSALVASDAREVLRQLEHTYELMTLECPSKATVGFEEVLLAFVEFCDHECTTLRNAATTTNTNANSNCSDEEASRVMHDAEDAYADASRRWAHEAREVTRIVAGDTSTAFSTWTAVLHPQQGCWREGGSGVRTAPPGEGAAPAAAEAAERLPFMRRWTNAGLLLSPLGQALALEALPVPSSCSMPSCGPPA